MRTRQMKLAGALLLLSTLSATAEEVMLIDGTSGDAKILATTEDSVSVEFEKDGGAAKFDLSASKLEPHSFYAIRSAHMEPTADNHIALARFCIEHEMFAHAQAQVAAARALDPEKVEELTEMPKVREGIAARLVDYARKELEKGRTDEAKKWASFVLTRLGDTKVAGAAQGVLDDIKLRSGAGSTEALRESTGSEEAKKAVAAIRQAMTKARAHGDKALRAKGATESYRGLEEAGKLFEECVQVAGKANPDGSDALLNDLADQARGEAVTAYINAAQVLVGRSSYSEARRLARLAVAVDEESSQATDFLQHVDMVEAMAGSRTRR